MYTAATSRASMVSANQRYVVSSVLVERVSRVSNVTLLVPSIVSMAGVWLLHAEQHACVTRVTRVLTVALSVTRASRILAHMGGA